MIHVIERLQTYRARAQGLGVTASCTAMAETAAARVAAKIYGENAFTLKRYGRSSTWIATSKRPASGATR